MEFEHDIAISYAGEDQELAGTIASKLEASGVGVFFASTQQAMLLGERLEDVFARTFGSTSRYVAVLVSEHYPIKDWTRYELSIARDEEKKRKEAFVLPLFLADARMVEIPPDKGYLDLRAMDLDAAIEILVEKVRLHRGEPSPKELFEAAFREWKSDGFLPGTGKGDVFWRNSKELELDVDRCEFLLRCSGGGIEWTRATLRRIEPAILREAGERLLETAATPGFELSAIGYIGIADPERAEFHLWRIYEDKEIHVNDRARAFEVFWRCPSARSHQEPKEVLVDETAPWPLRRAAANNILWGERDDDTENLLAQGLEDPRREVRSKVIDAIVKFRLDSLAPQVIEAYKRDRSRKGKADLKGALRLFNTRPDVIEFGRKAKLGKAFFKPPPYVHDWEANREDWV